MAEMKAAPYLEKALQLKRLGNEIAWLVVRHEIPK